MNSIMRPAGLAALSSFIGFVLLTAAVFAGTDETILFLHHSTGGNVYSEGNVPEYIVNYNTDHGTAFTITERAYPTTPYPWNNYPYDYWNLWLNGACDSSDPDIECLDSLAENYDIIIFKHCFPGAAVLADTGTPDISSSRKSLENYKCQYRALRDLMDSAAFADTKFIVWTLAPLHRLATNSADAARAAMFVDWVKNEWLDEDGGLAYDNIFVFDFWGLVAESNPSPVNGQVNCLKYDYERSHTGSDSHPNTAANEAVGPEFAQFIIDMAEGRLQDSDNRPNLVDWNGNLVADFGDNGLWYHDGSSWNRMTATGHVPMMAAWGDRLVVDFGADRGLFDYDGTWHWMTNRGGVADMLSWNNGMDDVLAVDFGSGRGMYVYDGSWHWLTNKDDINTATAWNYRLVVDFGGGRSIFNHDGTTWHWMTGKDDVAAMSVWNDGAGEPLVVDFGFGRGMYTYDGNWHWLSNRDDVNGLAAWNNRLVVDFGRGRAVFNYNGVWHWMTNRDDAAKMTAWNDGSKDNLAMDFGGGRGLYAYDGAWHWLNNKDDVTELIAWGDRLVADFGSGRGIYNYGGSWNWMKAWSTAE